MIKKVKSKSKMEALLKSEKEAVKLPKAGEVLRGEIVAMGSNEVYLDLGPIGTGLIYGLELKDGLGTYETLKLGDKLFATVIEPENENGYVELSLRKASLEKAWQVLEEKMEASESVKAKILDANKGGLIVEISGLTGFLPVSQLSTEHYPRVAEGDRNQILNHLRGYIGKIFETQVISLSQENEKLIVSEKASQFEEFNRIMKNLRIGEEVLGTVSGIADFGVFIKFQPAGAKEPIEGLVHISELSWQRVDDPGELVKVGDKLQARIASLSNNRISLSVKDLEKDPWKEIEKKYKVGDIVLGSPKRIDHFGAFVQLDKEIYGLAHTSQFKDINQELEKDKSFQFKIISLDPRERRLGLELVKSQPVKVKARAKKVVKKRVKAIKKIAKTVKALAQKPAVG